MAEDEPIIIKYVKLSSAAVEPSRAYEHDAAWDLTATRFSKVDEGDYGYLEYGTDIAVEIPPGYVGKIFPRSSISKTGLILSNSVGIVDPNYRGEIVFRFKWIKDTKRYEVGDRIGQIRIERTPSIKWELVTELSESERGNGAFGSSGN